MVKFIIAKQLTGKRALSVNGYEIGRFVDAELDSVTGRISALVLEPDADSPVARKLSGGSELRVPYSAVRSVADYIMVDTRNL